MYAIIIIGILILFYLWRSHPRTAPLEIAGRKWNVSHEYANAEESARLLDRVNRKMIMIMDYMRKKYHTSDTDDMILEEGEVHQRVVSAPNDVYNIVSALLRNYDPDVFYENDPRRSSDTSYTINKGQAMYVCTRKRSDPNLLEEIDDLLFVMLHEASHIANYNGWQHDRRFWEVFKFVLIQAAESGVYHPIDYSKYPIDYCGLKVNYNPFFDKGLKDLTHP
jgi:hypothetical protein